MKTKLLLILLLFGLQLSLNAQAKHDYKQGCCKLAGKIFSAESCYCAGCAEVDEKNRQAKIAEDKRVQAIAIKKAEEKRQKAIDENKKMNEKFAEQRKKNKENVVHIGVPKGNKVEKKEEKKEDLKETGEWVAKWGNTGFGFVDKALASIPEDQIQQKDWKIKPIPGTQYSIYSAPVFNVNYSILELIDARDISSPCGGNDARNTRKSIIINRKGNTLMESTYGEGFILLDNSPFVLKMIGGWSTMDKSDACNASIYMIAQNKEIYKLPHNSFGDENYLKTTAFSPIGLAYIDGEGIKMSWKSDYSKYPTFIEKIKSEIKKNNAIGCFIYVQIFGTTNRNNRTLVFFRKDGTYTEVKNIHEENY